MNVKKILNNLRDLSGSEYSIEDLVLLLGAVPTPGERVPEITQEQLDREIAGVEDQLP